MSSGSSAGNQAEEGAKILAVVSAGVIATVAGMVYFILQSTASPANISADLTPTLLVIVVLAEWAREVGALIGGVNLCF